MITSPRPRRPAVAAAWLAVVAVALAACGSARETTDRDAEIPVITGRPTPGTVDDEIATDTDGAVPPTRPSRTAPTVAPTAPVVTLSTSPLPTSVTTRPPTTPPATAASTVAPTASPTSPPTTPAPAPPTTAPPTNPPPTSPPPTSLTTTTTPVDPLIVRPGTTGPAVLAVQVALVAHGYPIIADGTYGPRTEAAVRDFQSRHGLEVDGISGPDTQHALGIGPAPAGTTPTTAAPSTAAPTTATPTTATPTTIADIGPREPRACTAEAIGSDIGRAVTSVVECHAGWAVGVRSGCTGAACNTVDLYQQASIGWVLIGEFDMTCAEGLMRSGMAPRVAASFVEPCSTTLPERINITSGSPPAAVANVQIALVAQGYIIGTDGTFGSRTEAAVRDWQQRNGLEVDGIAGPATQQSLGL